LTKLISHDFESLGWCQQLSVHDKRPCTPTPLPASCCQCISVRSCVNLDILSYFYSRHVEWPANIRSAHPSSLVIPFLLIFSPLVNKVLARDVVASSDTLLIWEGTPLLHVRLLDASMTQLHPKASPLSLLELPPPAQTWLVIIAAIRLMEATATAVRC
jgi:hypothetical protein